jgi:hypothetical protein
MDGTLVDSMAGVIGAWELFATKYPGLNVQEILGCRYQFFLVGYQKCHGWDDSYPWRSHRRNSPKVL